MKGREISSLYRSYSPRMMQYNSDGNGRDVYINYNNGGFWSQGVKVYAGAQRGCEISAKYKLKPLMKHVAPFKYNSDGSGRDSYVLSESGGLKRDHKAMNEFHLKDFLRTPQSCIFNFHARPTKDGVKIKTHYVSKAEFESNQYLKKIEKGVIERLYTKEKPKFTTKKTKDTNDLPMLDESKSSNKYSKTNPNFFVSSVDRINNYISTKKNYNDHINNVLHIKIKK